MQFKGKRAYRMKHFNIVAVLVALVLTLMSCARNMDDVYIEKSAAPEAAVSAEVSATSTGSGASPAVPDEAGARVTDGSEETPEADEAFESTSVVQTTSPSPSTAVSPSRESGTVPSTSAERSDVTAVSPTPQPSPSSSAPQPTPSPTDSGQPPLLTTLVAKAGYRFEDFNFSQLVLVAAGDTGYATLYCYDKGDDGLWKLSADIGAVDGFVGRNGVRGNKQEGDGTTPTGLYSLGYAFGNSPKPETALEYRPVTTESYWVDDPGSLYYNQWVEGKDEADWTSAEHLADNVKTYAYAVVVNYNMAPDTVVGAGSAVFLHCKTQPTSGCIAAPTDNILKILKWLKPADNPHMLILQG